MVDPENPSAAYIAEGIALLNPFFAQVDVRGPQEGARGAPPWTSSPRATDETGPLWSITVYYGRRQPIDFVGYSFDSAYQCALEYFLQRASGVRMRIGALLPLSDETRHILSNILWAVLGLQFRSWRA
jgi:hypothetical protein